jgi:hypothetical protein
MAGTFLLFANTFGNGWTFDDFPVIVENPDIRSIAGFLFITVHLVEVWH